MIAVLVGRAGPEQALFASDNPFGDFVRARGRPVLSAAVNAAVVLAILNAVLATMLQNGRFFFSTGRDQAWHPWLDYRFTLTHPKFHSPWFATLGAGATAAVMCFLGEDQLLKLGRRGPVGHLRWSSAPHAIAGRQRLDRARRAMLRSVRRADCSCRSWALARRRLYVLVSWPPRTRTAVGSGLIAGLGASIVWCLWLYYWALVGTAGAGPGPSGIRKTP